MRENAGLKARIIGTMETHESLLRPHYRVACPIGGLVDAILLGRSDESAASTALEGISEPFDQPRR
jgi:hypothetical protein